MARNNTKTIDPNDNHRSRVILIDDTERDFFAVGKVLEKAGCNLVLDYDEVLKLIANYNAYRTVASSYSGIFKNAVLKQIQPFLDDDEIIWVLDVCWITRPSIASPDRFGIEFMREFTLGKPILISLSPSDAYAHQIVGVKFVCKTNSSGEFMTDQFVKELNDAVNYVRKNSIDKESYQQNNKELCIAIK